jgi:urease accessory protein
MRTSNPPRALLWDNSIGLVNVTAMKIYTAILGNIKEPTWRMKARKLQVRYVELDQWTAQKSRFVVADDAGDTYAVKLDRGNHVADGDILAFDEETRCLTVFRVQLNEVMIADLGALSNAHAETLVRVALELGHALGNQHWPAVVKGTKVYVPLTVDRRVMESVMRTHRLEGVAYTFRPGAQVIPYLAPHEVRRLFGAAGMDNELLQSHQTKCHAHTH